MTTLFVSQPQLGADEGQDFKHGLGVGHEHPARASVTDPKSKEEVQRRWKPFPNGRHEVLQMIAQHINRQQPKR